MPTDAGLVARENDIVTCERGHPLYRMTRDVRKNERFRAEQFEPIHTRAQRPVTAVRIEMNCPMCGAPWWTLGLGLLVHFEDGWRP